jgi:hypothetical protein
MFGRQPPTAYGSRAASATNPTPLPTTLRTLKELRMSRTPDRTYQRRIDTLKRRRDFLDSRVADYQGKDNSRDKAEASALHWALRVLEANTEQATDFIAEELAAKDAAKAEGHHPTNTN